MFRRPIVAVAAAGLGLAVLAGCGDGGSGVSGDPGSSANPFQGMESPEIQQAIIDGMDEVDSLRVSADLVTDGDQMALVMELDRDANCDGSITMGGAKADIKGDGMHNYMRGDEAFWTEVSGGEAQAKQMMAFIGDKWLRTAAGGNDGFNEMCDLDSLLEEFEVNESDTDMEVGEPTEMDGHDVIELSNTEGDETTRMWVTTETPHRIVKMQVEGGDEPGEFSFSNYDEPVEVEVPGEGEWIDADSLGS